MKKVAKTSKVHTKYTLKNGMIVPGVTTITRQLGEKGGMVHVAWKLGTEGIDYRKHWDEKALIGTLTHEMIAGHFKDEEVDVSEYSQRVITQAMVCVEKFHAWKENHSIEPVLIEKQMVSEGLRFGGSVDFLGEVDGELTLLDFKTGKIYDETWYQIAGYSILIEEQGYNPTRFSLLRIPTDTDEVYCPMKKDLGKQREIFRLALGIYSLQKAIRREDG